MRISRSDFVKFVTVRDELSTKAQAVAKHFERVNFGLGKGSGFGYNGFEVDGDKFHINLQRYAHYDDNPEDQYLTFSVDNFLYKSEDELITDGMIFVEAQVQKLKDLDIANKARAAAERERQELRQLEELKKKYEKKVDTSN